MNEKETFIALFRKMMNWEWYTDVPVKTLFIHCLLRANYYDNMYRGKLIKRGSFTTSLNELSIQTGLTIKQIRTALTKLKKTNEIEVKGANTHTLVTVVNYDKYQVEEKEKGNPNDNQKANKGQTKGKQRATNNKVNKENKVNNNTNNTYIVEIVDLLNDLTGGKYKSTTNSTKESLNARLKDYSVDEIKSTVRKMCKKWKGTEYEEYLRPSTLFTPTNFEKYYNMKGEPNGEDELTLTKMAGITTL